MKLNRVLIVTKPRGEQRKRSPVAKSREIEAERAKALARIEHKLRGMGIAHTTVTRFAIPATRSFDLVISFGGDGTFLAAAHKAGCVPILGVNAAPDHSVGFYCAAAPNTFDRVLARIISGKMKLKQAPLIEARVDGRRLPCPALNDVLFAGSSPAETVRYRISANGRSEEQKSSGVWISSGPGSTAAIKSAGGRPMPMFSQRLQFLVREPCPRPGSRYRMARGVIAQGRAIEIESHMRTARAYIDGHWHACAVKQGSTISCRVSKKKLKIFI